MLKRGLFIFCIWLGLLPLAPITMGQEDEVLTQSITINAPEEGVSVTVGVPDGWNFRYSNREFTLASNESLYSIEDEDTPELESWEVALWMSFEETESAVSADAFTDTQIEGFSYGEATPIELGNLNGFQLPLQSDETEMLNGALYVLNFSEGLAIQAAGVSGNYSENEETVLAILASLEITPIASDPDTDYMSIMATDESVRFSVEFPSEWVFHTGGGLTIANSEQAIGFQ